MEIAVFAAAVADDTPAVVAPGKIKKSGDSFTLELIKTKDILGSARSVFGYQGALVGFAAETENLGTNAGSKRSYHFTSHRDRRLWMEDDRTSWQRDRPFIMLPTSAMSLS